MSSPPTLLQKVRVSTAEGNVQCAADALSLERLAPYLHTTGGDLADAVPLDEWNHEPVHEFPHQTDPIPRGSAVDLARPRATLPNITATSSTARSLLARYCATMS